MNFKTVNLSSVIELRENRVYTFFTCILKWEKLSSGYKNRIMFAFGVQWLERDMSELRCENIPYFIWGGSLICVDVLKDTTIHLKICLFIISTLCLFKGWICDGYNTV